MGKTFGGYAIKKVNNHRISKDICHKITINKNSILFKILNKEEIMVNSLHSFAISNTSLDISAYSSDGIIEAVESKNRKFFLGIQWHPELLDYEYSKKIFNYFINCL